MFYRSRRRPMGCSPRLLIAGVIALVSVITYYSASDTNPITGETQRVAMSVKQEIALGLQAAPQMAKQHGGLHPDRELQAKIDAVGNALLATPMLANHPYRFEFHLLADPSTVNAFALPGGQVFITYALFDRLKTEGQLAGVLGHEIGHVIERHSAQQLAKARLTQGLTGAAVIASYDPDNPASRASGAVALMIGQLMNLRYGREDELESDAWGVRLLVEAGYDPQALIEVMKVLEKASGGGSAPEFMSTHPNPGNRIERIEAAIREKFPGGVPAGLKP